MTDKEIGEYLDGLGMKKWLGERGRCFVCDKRDRMPVYEHDGFLAASITARRNVPDLK